MSNYCGCKRYLTPSQKENILEKKYKRLLEKYKSLCLKVAAIVKELKSTDEDDDGAEDKSFLLGLYPFLEKLSTEDKFLVRVSFLKLLYKFSYNEDMTVEIPHLKFHESQKRISNESITLYQPDEENFYVSMLSFLKELPTDRKCEFKASFMRDLYKMIYNKEPTTTRGRRSFDLTGRQNTNKTQNVNGSNSVRSSNNAAKVNSNSPRGSDNNPRGSSNNPRASNNNPMGSKEKSAEYDISQQLYNYGE